MTNKTRIFKRYILNVRKLPMRLPTFISATTEAKNDAINKYGAEFTVKTDGYGASEYHRALYIITRILKPIIVIETGVFEGHSAISVLLAMEANNKGFLYSIDLPSPDIPFGKVPGWMVPEHLRNRWDLRAGKSSDLLPPLLLEVEDVDIFLHDSEHSYENMYWEYKTAWDHIKPSGALLSHDVSQNAAFKDFAKHVSEEYYYMLKNLGGIKRTK